jgi:hypothetical protein
MLWGTFRNEHVDLFARKFMSGGVRAPGPVEAGGMTGIALTPVTPVL